MTYEFQEEAPRILVVDDEQVIREILCDFLTMEGFVVRTANDGRAALEELRRRSYNLVISDLKMPELSGIELLEKTNDLNLNVLTVIMTGFGTVETAIDAMKKGAYDYILKPFKVDEVVHIARRALERQQLQLENIRLKEALSLYKLSEAVSQSLSLNHVLELIMRATCEEMHADMVTLLLEKEGHHGEFIEKIRGGQSASDDAAGELKINELLRNHERDVPLLAHGARTHRFFNRIPEAHRLVSFCSVPLRIRHRIIGMLNVYSFRRGRKFAEGQRKMLSILAGRAATSIENARLYEGLLQSSQELETANQSLEENFRQTIVGFANALEESDRYTRGHSERVADFSRIIAEELKLGSQFVDKVILAARVHDIGKIGIPTKQLNKPGPLTLDEVAMFRTHPSKGKRILEPVPFLRELISGAYCHHERYDGKGYPCGLKGEEIPMLGRIIAVADAYDAMTSNRAYRRALSNDKAISELKRCAGTQFDPEIAMVFVKALIHRQGQKSDENELPRAAGASGS